MYAKITKDLLYKPGDKFGTLEDRTGHVVFASEGERKDDPLLLDVLLLDDDRIPYYEALADDESLESLCSWAMHDAGVTILQVKKDGQWEDVIS